jgi:hypothetical protein
MHSQGRSTPGDDGDNDTLLASRAHDHRIKIRSPKSWTASLSPPFAANGQFSLTMPSQLPSVETPARELHVLHRAPSAEQPVQDNDRRPDVSGIRHSRARMSTSCPPLSSGLSSVQSELVMLLSQSDSGGAQLPAPILEMAHAPAAPSSIVDQVWHGNSHHEQAILDSEGKPRSTTIRQLPYSQQLLQRLQQLAERRDVHDMDADALAACHFSEPIHESDNNRAWNLTTQPTILNYRQTFANAGQHHPFDNSIPQSTNSSGISIASRPGYLQEVSPRSISTITSPMDARSLATYASNNQLQPMVADAPIVSPEVWRLRGHHPPQTQQRDFLHHQSHPAPRATVDAELDAALKTLAEELLAQED